MEDAIRHFSERQAYVDLGKIYCRFSLLRLGEGKLYQSDETFGKAADAWQQAKLPAYPLLYRSSVYEQHGRFEEAFRLLEQAREMGDDPFMRDFPGMSVSAFAYEGLGQACVALGVLDEALVHFERMGEIYEAMDMPFAHCPLYTPGTVLRLRGQMEAARREIEKEVAIVRSIGFKQRIVARLDELARLEYDEGNYVRLCT
jgi:tetratricopeptide (TPR) repeat protein